MFEPLLVRGMRMGLVSSSKDMLPYDLSDDLTEPPPYYLGDEKVGMAYDYLRSSMHPGLPQALRPRLLQLFCLHAPDTGVDIFAEGGDITALANISWPCEVFNHLEVEQSVKLLENLKAVNPNFSFLLAPHDRKVSILGLYEVAEQKNFNVDLLQTMLLRGDPAALQSARDAVEKLRQRSDAARDHGDRAALAEAASVYAIASGDLELYGETIVWQQHFVKDFRRTRKLFGPSCMLIEEGIELLSAVPGLNASHMDLESTKDSISEADCILKPFWDSYNMPYRGPKFKYAGYSGSCISLFVAVYAERIKWMRKVRGAQRAVWKSFWSTMQWRETGLSHNYKAPVRLSSTHWGPLTSQLQPAIYFVLL